MAARFGVPNFVLHEARVRAAAVTPLVLRRRLRLWSLSIAPLPGAFSERA
jgi:hypothetical protein